MATKLDLIQAVMREVGYATSDEAATDQFRIWFDDGLETLLAEWEWPFRVAVVELDVTAAGFESVALPIGTAEVQVMRDSATRTEIPYADADRLIAEEYDLTELGTPRLWYRVAPEDDLELISFFPLPSSDFTAVLSTRVQVPEALSDGATIPAPREALSYMREVLRAYAYENLNQSALADRAWERAAKKLTRLGRSRVLSRDERPGGVQFDGDLRTARTRAPGLRYPRHLGE